MVHAVPYRYIVISTVLSAPTVPTTPKLGHVASLTTCVLSFVQVSLPSSVKPMNLVLSIAAKNILTGDSAQCDFGVLAVPVHVHSPCNVSEGGAARGATAFSPQAARAITATTVWIRMCDLDNHLSARGRPMGGQELCRPKLRLRRVFHPAVSERVTGQSVASRRHVAPRHAARCTRLPIPATSKLSLSL